jgi:xanthine dehydrogenase accessory factor
MTGHWARIAAILASHGRAARVVVAATRGSTPREIGAALVMRPDGGFHGTIGGGALEWRLLESAGRRLRDGDPGRFVEEVVLGPDLGQCCGGRVTAVIEVLDRDDLAEARWLEVCEAKGPFLLASDDRDGRIRRTLVDDPASEPGSPATAG